MKYNYVLLGPDWDLYRQSFYDIIQQDNVNYVSGFYEFLSPLSSIIRRIQFTPLLNRHCQMPWKGYWNKYIKKYTDFKDSSPICFVFFVEWLPVEIHANLTSYLRKHYPGCKIVLFAQDLLSTIKDPDSGCVISFESYKDRFDFIVSYDKNESNELGVAYYHTVLSYCEIKDNNLPETDVYFLGRPKQRLSLIKDIYKRMSSLGLKCEFIILQATPEEQEQSKELIHISKSISYVENLKHVQKTKCVLELLQDNACSYTFRTWEAMLYDKMLLTNNKAILDSTFYDVNDTMYISDSNSIDEKVIMAIKNRSLNHRDFRKELSPVGFLCFLESHI